MQIAFINDVVPLENTAGLVAANEHRDFLGHSKHLE